MCIPRARVDSATVYVDVVNGSDSNDGTAPAPAVGTVGPLKTLQRALDYAAGNFDCAAPFSWTEIGNVGYRSGVTVQMAPAPAATPYLMPQPAFLDGLSTAGPITLRGDPTSRTSILSYNLYANNSLQGLTAQNGGALICEGFTIRGDANCTLINPLEGGKVAVSNVFLGQGSSGPVGAMGAAGGSQLDLIGPITLIGAGFSAVLAAIEDGRISIAPDCPISLDNVMNFGLMVDLYHASIWTQGSPPIWSGSIAGSTGQSYVAVAQSFLGFDHTLIPGSAGYSDATSTVL